MATPREVRLGINGFGRIGRAVFRAVHKHSLGSVVMVNDRHGDGENLRYLLMRDSLYGRFPAAVEARDDGAWTVEGRAVQVLDKQGIADVDWAGHGTELVIDAASTHENHGTYRKVLAGGVRSVVVTSSLAAETDCTIVCGVNEAAYRPDRHRVVGASTCDAIALAPVVRQLEDTFGLVSGFVITLHPWLSHQNLLDAPLQRSALSPRDWQEYGIGRAATMNLIPKATSLVDALTDVLPEVAPRLGAISFRVPTPAVCSAHVVATLRRPTSVAQVNEAFERSAAAPGSTVGYEVEHQVSTDFLGEERAVVIDGRWTQVHDRRTASLIVWYDNEWGYATNVVRLVRLLTSDGNA
ncbi:MAG: glyceraldehyde 3-phosphate dehydrogenase NAD-binding domain-containing protein [Egibacteraceae bacterium]